MKGAQSPAGSKAHEGQGDLIPGGQNGGEPVVGGYRKDSSEEKKF